MVMVMVWRVGRGKWGDFKVRNGDWEGGWEAGFMVVRGDRDGGHVGIGADCVEMRVSYLLW